jgi:transposase
MITTMPSDRDCPPPRVEVITSMQRRRRWSAAEKVRLVEETMHSVSYVARRAGVAPSLLFNWRRRMLEGGLRAVQADGDVVGTSRIRELERRVRELERLLGRKTMEVELLKVTLDVARVAEQFQAHVRSTHIGPIHFSGDRDYAQEPVLAER